MSTPTTTSSSPSSESRSTKSTPQTSSAREETEPSSSDSDTAPDGLTSQAASSGVFPSGSSTPPSVTPSPLSALIVTSVASSGVSSTAPPAPSTVSTSAAQPPGNGPGLGAWIGISVGCGAGGLLIGLLLAMLFLRRRSKAGTGPEPQPEAETETETRALRPKSRSFDSQTCAGSPVVPPEPTHRGAPMVPGLEQFLAVPTSDKELSSELRSLGHLIEQHVEDYYHLSPVTQSEDALREALQTLGLARTGKGVPSPEHLASLALEPETRHAALRHVISRVLFDSVSVKSTGQLSMLPTSLSVLIRNMPPCEAHLGNPEAVSLALTRWRQLSAFLLNPRRSDRGPMVPEESAIKPLAKDVVTAANKVLAAFVSKEHSIHQEKHLQDVALECAKFGYVIISQPAEFVWEFRSDEERGVAVCPGLEKVADDQGRTCIPETVATPEIHQF